MNHEDINQLSPEELQLEKDLKDQLKHFKAPTPQGMEDRIFAALQTEHDKELKQKTQPGFEWFKLLAAACLIFGLGVTYQFNATYLNNLINQEEETISLFELISQAQKRVASMDRDATQNEARTYGEIFLAQQADAFMSDLAILTFDPDRNFMNQQQKLEDVVKGR